MYRYSPVLTALTAKERTPQSDQPLNNHLYQCFLQTPNCRRYIQRNRTR